MAEMSVVTASILSRPPPFAQLATVSADAPAEALADGAADTVDVVGAAAFDAVGTGAEAGWLELQPARRTSAANASPAFAAITGSLEGHPAR